MLIDTLTGNQNFNASNAKVYVFITPTRGQDFVESHLFAAASIASTGVRKQSGGGRINAVEGASMDFGSFTQTVFNVPEGALLKLFVQRKQPHSQTTDQACRFVRLREGAALNRLDVPLNEWASVQVTLRRAYIEGRFDLISLEEAERLGARVNPLHRRFFNYPSTSGLIVPVVLAEQITSPVVVERTVVKNSDGEQVQIDVRRSRRMIDI